MLEFKDLKVAVDGKEIVKGVSLAIRPGEIHALMGPNGSGKTSLAYGVMGHPRYTVTGGSALLDGVELVNKKPEERAKTGLFLSFQYPLEISGVSFANFMRTALISLGNGNKVAASEVTKRLKEEFSRMRLEPNFASRSVNEGFSGGEKKRAEILQLRILKPKYAILDECDSGLDVDGLRVVAQAIRELMDSGSTPGILLITHYQRILKYLEPDYVHVMVAGMIVTSGGKELARTIEERGYDWLRLAEFPSAPPLKPDGLVRGKLHSSSVRGPRAEIGKPSPLRE